MRKLFKGQNLKIFQEFLKSVYSLDDGNMRVWTAVVHSVALLSVG